MATAHYSRFGSFGGDILRASDSDGYIRYCKNDVAAIKKWLGCNSPGGSDEEIETVVRNKWGDRASNGSILVAMSLASIEEWRGQSGT